MVDLPTPLGFPLARPFSGPAWLDIKRQPRPGWDPTEVRRYQEWAAAIEHKPDWSFTVTDGPWSTAASNGWSCPHMRIEARVVDSYTGERTLIAHTFELPWCEDERESYEVVLQLVDGIERHETREFFRVAGRRFKDPHPAPGEVRY